MMIDDVPPSGSVRRSLRMRRCGPPTPSSSGSARYRRCCSRATPCCPRFSRVHSTIGSSAPRRWPTCRCPTGDERWLRSTANSPRSHAALTPNTGPLRWRTSPRRAGFSRPRCPSIGSSRTKAPAKRSSPISAAMASFQTLAMIPGSLLAAPVAGGAQAAAKLWRIGYLGQGSEANNRLYVDGLRQGLGDLGRVEGRTIVFESRFAEGKTDQLPRLAADLGRAKMGGVVPPATPAALAAKHPPTTVPIVIGFVADPVGSGIVASLARPGGNITGGTHSGRALPAKHLERIKAAV